MAPISNATVTQISLFLLSNLLSGIVSFLSFQRRLYFLYFVYLSKVSTLFELIFSLISFFLPFFFLPPLWVYSFRVFFTFLQLFFVFSFLSYLWLYIYTSGFTCHVSIWFLHLLPLPFEHADSTSRLCCQELRLQVRARAVHTRLPQAGEEADRDPVSTGRGGEALLEDDTGVPDRLQDFLPHCLQVC